MRLAVSLPRPRRLALVPAASAVPSVPDAEALAAWLYQAHRGESVRALEGLAAVAVARDGGLPRAVRPLPPEARRQPAYAVARRIAARALAGSLSLPFARARRVHRLGALPAWAAGLTPLAMAGGFVFYTEEPEEQE